MDTCCEMKCPECGEQLTYEDYFGPIVGWNKVLNEPIIKHEGDIYFCEKCQQQYHQPDNGELRSGYPC